MQGSPETVFLDDYGDDKEEKYVDKKEAEAGGGDVMDNNGENDNGSDDKDVVGIHTN